MKYFIVLLLFSHISLSQIYYVNKEIENIRDKPNGKKIGLLLKNTEVKQMSSDGEWIKVSIEGWIYKPSVSKSKVQNKPVAKKYRTVGWDSNMYSKAGTERYGDGCNKKIGTINKGEKLEILNKKVLSTRGISVPWYYVKRNNGRRGWVSDADLVPE